MNTHDFSKQRRKHALKNPVTIKLVIGWESFHDSLRSMNDEHTLNFLQNSTITPHIRLMFAGAI